MSNESGSKKQRGCFFYGCLSLTVLGLIVTVFIAVGVYFAKRTVDGLINDYTATTPEKIEELVYPDPKLKELQSRVDTFQQAVEKGSAEPLELVLSADDLNAWIASNPDSKGKVFVRIEDDQVKGQVSAPLPDVGPFKLKGRYLNGTAAFKVVLSNGLLEVRLEQVSVKDKPLPPLILEEFNKGMKQELTRELQKDPKVGQVIERLDSLEIRDGKVIIRSRPVPGAAPAGAAPPEPATPRPAAAAPDR